ncbi:MAG TPA: helicase-associated domain-containing protein, partial [Gemmataceae bacterium]|nr:helicase-associated domain-containing protein [Gemmataceae bacterium]
STEQSAIRNPQSAMVQEADGLEWPLRLSVLWQQVAGAPLRLTQQGDFFKRDFERLRTDPLLNGPPGGGLAELPDIGLLAVALARELGIVEEDDGELRAAVSPTVPADGPAETAAALWAALLRIGSWDPQGGWRGDPTQGNPYPSAYLLALLLLARLNEGAWAAPAEVEAWVAGHHPYWSASAGKSIGLSAFLLGLAYDLCLVQAGRTADGEWRVRLSGLGRWLLGVGEQPASAAEFPQTLLVQPNLEIVAYRQGLTPGLVGRLGRFAAWTSLGAACTLRLDPHTVYRALESGLTFEEMVQTLERHGTRSLPAAVLESLRTWADKRDRIIVLPSAVLLEFASADDLNEALARGLPGLRLTERLAAVANESAIDFRHFRLTGTRDYGLPPEKCIDVGPDGVTLAVDAARSDLMLECELPRFAEPLAGPSPNGQRLYRLTPASLRAARAAGFDLPTLEAWFQQRTGRPIPPATRLLLTAGEAPAPALRRCLVLEVGSEELADGLMQWPATRALIEARLGPTTLAVAEDQAERLRQQLEALGMCLRTPAAGL